MDMTVLSALPCPQICAFGKIEDLGVCPSHDRPAAKVPQRSIFSRRSPLLGQSSGREGHISGAPEPSVAAGADSGSTTSHSPRGLSVPGQTSALPPCPGTRDLEAEDSGASPISGMAMKAMRAWIRTPAPGAGIALLP